MFLTLSSLICSCQVLLWIASRKVKILRKFAHLKMLINSSISISFHQFAEKSIWCQLTVLLASRYPQKQWELGSVLLLSSAWRRSPWLPLDLTHQPTPTGVVRVVAGATVDMEVMEDTVDTEAVDTTTDKSSNNRIEYNCDHKETSWKVLHFRKQKNQIRIICCDNLHPYFFENKKMLTKNFWFKFFLFFVIQLSYIKSRWITMM